MISKELLSEILKEYKFPFSYEYNTYNDYTKKIYFYVNSELKIDFFSINIYELSDICKHKITSKFPMFSIKWHPNYVKGTPPACVKVWVQGELLGNQPTEPEAVFQAYQELLTKGLL